MNKYRYHTNWTEPSCDHPFVPYFCRHIGFADSVQELKDNVYNIHNYENFHVSDIELLEENIDSLKPNSTGSIEGYSTRLGTSIIITAATKEELMKAVTAYWKGSGNRKELPTFDPELVVKTETKVIQ